LQHESSIETLKSSMAVGLDTGKGKNVVTCAAGID